MLILPLKFVREEDKKTVGENLYNLAKLNHLGLPVIESVVAIADIEIFKKAIEKHLKRGVNLGDSLPSIKKEILSLRIPESLNSFEMVSFQENRQKLSVNTLKLWQNLLEKWSYELISKISRGEKKIFDFTPQLIVFSANFSAFGKGFFDEDRSHVVIKVDQGKLDFKNSQDIENLILLANRKMLLAHVYHWAIEDGKIVIIKVSPFTQTPPEKTEEKIEKFIPARISEQAEAESKIVTATKIFLDFSEGILNDLNCDGVLLRLKKADVESIDKELGKILKIKKDTKVLFYPEFENNTAQYLEFAKSFLFFRNKKGLDISLSLPKIFFKDEFLEIKRELASLGIYSKGGLKIWKQFSNFADFVSLDSYLDLGFDGAIINLDEIAKNVVGVESEKIIKSPKLDWLEALEDFFKLAGLSKIIKSGKPVLLIGKISESEELLNYFVRSGVWGISFEKSAAGNIKEHICFIEKQAVKKLINIEVKH